jgi:DNA-binding winged helix-turn-helix (wHTH) protein
VSAGGATTREAPQSIVFSSFRLDLRGGQLTRAGTPIPLRPKTWAVLVHLAERPGLLVTKEELLDAVWPDVAVTPDTLTKSIGELRLALGDDSTMPRFIATVHRRGFRFMEQTDLAPESNHPAPAWRAGDAATRPFVGRAAELRQLAEHFARSCAGERQVLFVTGPAGVGKTTLLDASLDSPAVHAGTPTVWIGRGRCVEQHGPREPYMPVLSALAHLARRRDAAGLLGLLRRTAPTWLAQMPWLLGDDEDALRASLQAARAERMLREFAALTEALTADVTLVLVLEDLHWSDPATVDLLSLLGQRREPARLLVVGTYRPAELAVQEHPLSRAVRTLQLHRQCVELPVHELTEADVQSYLEARFPGARLPSTLVSVLHAHTDGNPLFVSAVVEHMVASGWVIETAPGWSFTAAPGALDLGVPDDARRMIATQVESLSPADRNLLGAASVAGHEFAAQTVAAALRCELDDVEARCETLARPQRFLRFAGSSERADGTVALRYAFTHALYRQAVYEGIPEGTRQRLHQRVGEALETVHGERAGEIAGELASHFASAGDCSRALRYLTAAAAGAQQRFAGREASSYLEAAIALTARLPDAAKRRHHELELRIALAPLLNDLNGFASEELKQNCERAYALCTEVGGPVQRFQILYALCHVHVVRADPVRAPALLQELSDLARHLGAAQYRVLADSGLARSAAHQGRFAEVCSIAEGPLSSHLHGVFSKRPPAYGADPLIATNCHYAYALWFLGHPDQARATMNVSYGAAARPRTSPFTRAAALALMTVLEVLCRNPTEVRHLADQLGALSDEHGFPFWSALASALRGWARIQLGELREGTAELERARVRHAATGARIFSSHILAFLAEARLRAGEFAAGLANVDEGLHVAETTLDRAFWPELWRLKGELLLAAAGAPRRPTPREESDWNEIAACLQNALELAREMRAKSLELRAAISLARAWQARGRAAEAHDLLEDICQWFGTTSTSLDLVEARALRAQLALAPPAPVRNRRRAHDRV